MMTVEGWLKVIELGLVGLISAKVFGQFWQRREDIGSANAGRIAEIDARLTALCERVQALREINIAKRLSVVESTQENFEKHVYREYMSKELCRALTQGQSKEHNGDHPRKASD